MLRIDVNERGKFYYNKNNEYHREDGPAYDGSNGSKKWYINGKKHRENGPAIEWLDGSKHWYKDGVHHREDGPAIIYVNGTKEWYKDGKCHRKDGPTKTISIGNKEWCINGKERQVCCSCENNPSRFIIEDDESDNDLDEEQRFSCYRCRC